MVVPVVWPRDRAGMLMARQRPGRMTQLKNAAIKEEAEKLAKEKDRLKVARTLLGPRGGLPTLKGDLVKLAQLLRTEVKENLAVDFGPLFEHYGSDIDPSLVREYVDEISSNHGCRGRGPQECCHVSAGGEPRIGAAGGGREDGGHGRALPGYVLPGAAPRDADAGGLDDGASCGAERGRLDDRGGCGRLGAPRPQDREQGGAGRLKPGQRLLLSQAWDRRRRDQVLISCSARQVRKAMADEHKQLYMKGIHEAFVMEIPIVCSEVFSDTEPVVRAAQPRSGPRRRPRKVPLALCSRPKDSSCWQ